MPNKRNVQENKRVFTYFLVALFLRLSMLVVYYFFQDKLGDYLYIDDWKYEYYANLYMQFAEKPIDFSAMRLADTALGGVNVAHFFFRYNAVLFYITSSTLALRLSNIFIGSLTVFPIYYLTKELFDERVAKTATNIFVFLPYHILMSVFVFKDIWMVFLFSSALYYVVYFFNYGRLKIIPLTILLIPLPWIRDGLALFIIMMLVWALFIKYWIANPTVRNKIFIGLIAFAIVGVFVFRETLLLLLSRVEFYMLNGRSEGGGINLIRIDSIKQIYKLPLTWVFSTFFPISTNFEISKWSDILMLLNYTLFFISPAYIIYILFVKKEPREWMFFIPLLALHLVVIILVINIPRHYYFLHFYMIIGASAFITRLKNAKELQLYLAVFLMEVVGFVLASQILLT